MVASLISNPPFNLSWTAPALCGFMPEYAGFNVEKLKTANYAFILSGLSKIDDVATYILPCSVLNPANDAERDVVAKLLALNVLDAVIRLPDSMFESTSIPTCILRFKRTRTQTRRVMFFDLTNHAAEETRDQRGQFGGDSHTKRVYKKTFNVIPPELIKRVVDALDRFEDVDGFCRAVDPNEIEKNNYILTPTRYISAEVAEVVHRSYKDIAADYTRIVNAKNSVTFCFNETAAKRLGVLFYKDVPRPDINKTFSVVGETVPRENFISFTKSDGITIKCKTSEGIPRSVMLFVEEWKTLMTYLNDEENRLLAELRDALLPDIMNGKIDVSKLENED